jgi:hypothetical protein
MKQALNLLLLELLKFPNSPKTYRELQVYYAKEGKATEAKAFGHLLETRFKEMPSLNDHNANPHQQQ